MKRAVTGALLTLLVAAAAHAGSTPRDLRLSYDAKLLGRSRDVRVHLPVSYEADSASGRRYPVVYLLHGFPGGSNDWIARGHAGEIADSLAASGAIPEVILVCPDGDRGFFGRSLWADRWDGSFPLARSVAHDLVPWVDATFRTRADAAGRALVGLSDGATGGLDLLRANPALFSAWAGHSGDYRLTLDLGMRGIVGPDPEGSRRLRELSPLLTLLRREDVPHGARLYLDCGRDDDDIADNRELHARLDSLGVAHEWHEYAGAHGWAYWRQHLHQSLTAVCRGMDSGDAAGAESAAGSAAQ